jgi:hypothetical protein
MFMPKEAAGGFDLCMIESGNGFLRKYAGLLGEEDGIAAHSKMICRESCTFQLGGKLCYQG